MAFDPLSFIIGQQTAKGSGGGSSDTVLLKEQTINNFTPNEEFGGLYSAEIMPPPFRFEIGKKYNVVWDGEEWECAAQDVSTIVPGSVAIGDASSFGFEGNDEPFAIVTNGTGLAFFAFDTKTSHTIKIYQKAESLDGGSELSYEYFDGYFNATGTQMNVAHSIGKVPDILLCYKRESIPKANMEPFIWFAYSNAMLEKLNEDALCKTTIYSTSIGVFETIGRYGIDSDGGGETNAYAKYGGIRNCTASQFTIGGSSAALESGAQYGYYAICGLT